MGMSQLKWSCALLSKPKNVSTQKKIVQRQQRTGNSKERERERLQVRQGVCTFTFFIKSVSFKGNNFEI